MRNRSATNGGRHPEAAEAVGPCRRRLKEPAALRKSSGPEERGGSAKDSHPGKAVGSPSRRFGRVS
eukprot:4080816-Heterocapsa_arctica.AAC.1